LPSVLFLANEAINLVRGEQVAMLGVAEAAFGAVEVPEGLSVHKQRISNIAHQVGSGEQGTQGENGEIRHRKPRPFRAGTSVRARRRSIGGHSPGLQARKRYFRKESPMTAEELASCIELLIMEGRASGLSDETMASQLQDAADALREGVS
jgi:hypothetical protein